MLLIVKHMKSFVHRGITHMHMYRQRYSSPT